MDIIDAIYIIIIGIVEGITEWLPVSSTGHMLLVDEIITLNMTEEFKEMFFVVIQLGAILAVVVVFWNKMFPFNLKPNEKEPFIKKDIFSMWFHVIVACIPAIILGPLVDDWLEANFGDPVTIAIMLIVYGVAFIVIENKKRGKTFAINDISEITYKTAFIIGLFQLLAMIPGTSRSGATIVGALLIGVSRVAAAEFTFFLAVPVMLGASLLKVIKFGFVFTMIEIQSLLLGSVVAFLVSLVSIKFLMGYVRKHDFKVFGWYRIILGVVVIAWFMV